MPLTGANEKPLYSGTLDCTKKTIAKEGIRGLYKGIHIFQNINIIICYNSVLYTRCIYI